MPRPYLLALIFYSGLFNHTILCDNCAAVEAPEAPDSSHLVIPYGLMVTLTERSPHRWLLSVRDMTVTEF